LKKVGNCSSVIDAILALNKKKSNNCRETENNKNIQKNDYK